MIHRWNRALGAMLLMSIAAASTFAHPTTGPLPQSAVVAFVGGTVVPMDRERLLPDHTVLVRNGTIESVGPRSAVAVPPGATIVDAEGRYLMPGLADMHTHVQYVEDLLPYTAHGVTTILNMGGASALTRWREQIRLGQIVGPQVLLGWFVDGEGGAGGVVLSVEAARDAVRQAAASGYEYIKVYNSLSTAQFDAIAEEAARRSISVIGHGVRDPGMQHILENGMRLVAHGEEFIYTYFGNVPDRRRIPAAAELVRRTGAYVLPNLSTYEIISIQWGKPSMVDQFFERPESRFQHPGHRRTWARRRYADRIGSIEDRLVFLRDMTKAFADAGVPLLTGTDSPGIPGMYPGPSMHDDLRNFVIAGLTPYQALSAATRVPGEFVAATTTDRQPFGTIAPGQRADLILLRANPLESVDAVRALDGVMAAGRWYPPEFVLEQMLEMASRWL
ncbi:MAG: amidohydrolase family protein [Acidobacteria bacterium]|nr:amidohydrolase family protein [Acidobacteriota bacterium]